MPKKIKADSPDAPDKKPETKKVFDVSSPGETEPNATSRPVIIGHKPMIKNDPMVTEDTPKDEDEKPSAPTLGKPLTLKPINRIDVKDDSKNAEELSSEVKSESSTSKNDEQEVKDDVKESAEPAEERPAEDGDKVNENEETVETDDVAKIETQTEEGATPETTDEETDNNPATTDDTNTPKTEDSEIEGNKEADQGTAVENELADQVSLKKEDKEKQAKRAKELEKVNSLVESKKYFVKIYQGPGGTSYRVWTILLILLIVIAIGAYLGIDAGLVDIGVELPFSLV